MAILSDICYSGSFLPSILCVLALFTFPVVNVRVVFFTYRFSKVESFLDFPLHKC